MKYKGKYSLNENLLKGRGLGLLKEGLLTEGWAEWQQEVVAALGGGIKSGIKDSDAGKLCNKGQGVGVEVKASKDAVEGKFLQHAKNSSDLDTLVYKGNGVLTYTLADTSANNENLADQQALMDGLVDIIKADHVMIDKWKAICSPDGDWDMKNWSDPDSRFIGVQKAKDNSLNGTLGKYDYSAAEQNATYQRRGCSYMVLGTNGDYPAHIFHTGDDPLQIGCPLYNSGDLNIAFRLKGYEATRVSMDTQKKGGGGAVGTSSVTAADRAALKKLFKC